MPFRKFGYGQDFEGIVIDTNLLLLLAVGLFNAKLIKDFKRTQKYDVDDFDRLRVIIAYCKNKIYTTPNILTELTNLSDGINTDGAFFSFLKHLISEFSEVTRTSVSIINDNNQVYLKLGLTDASISDISDKRILILTDDLPLYHLLLNQSKPVINYNHLRTF